MRQVRRSLTSNSIENARKLRATSSVAEAIAWKLLRHEQTGFSFRRQHPVGPYILDFYCVEARLAVEFDGEQHDEIGDATRDASFLRQGVKTFRIPNRKFFEIDHDPTDWIQLLVKECESRAGRAAFPHP